MISINLSPGARHLLKENAETVVQKALNSVLEESSHQLNETIKMRGIAPSTHGNFKNNHRVIPGPDCQYIINPQRASDGTPIWKYITGGHCTLTTDTSRAWWFQHYKRRIMGEITLVKHRDHLVMCQQIIILSAP